MKKTFADRLNLALKSKNISAAALSRQTGISKGMLSDYLHNKHVPKQDKVYILAQALQVNTQWLLGYEDNMEPQQKKDTGTAHKITSKDIFTANGQKITGQEILDLINERLNQK